MSTNPNKIITLQELINAQVDAYKLELIMNEAPWVEITTRLGRKCYSIATIQGIIDQYKILADQELDNLRNAIEIVAAAGAGANGWIDSFVATWSGRTQKEENKAFVSSVNDYSELNDIAAEDGRSIFVRNENKIYRYDASSELDTTDLSYKDARGRVWLTIPNISHKTVNDYGIKSYFDRTTEALNDSDYVEISKGDFTNTKNKNKNAFSLSGHVPTKTTGEAVINIVDDVKSIEKLSLGSLVSSRWDFALGFPTNKSLVHHPFHNGFYITPDFNYIYTYYKAVPEEGYKACLVKRTTSNVLISTVELPDTAPQGETFTVLADRLYVGGKLQDPKLHVYNALTGVEEDYYLWSGVTFTSRQFASIDLLDRDKIIVFGRKSGVGFGLFEYRFSKFTTTNGVKTLTLQKELAIPDIDESVRAIQGFTALNDVAYLLTEPSPSSPNNKYKTIHCYRLTDGFNFENKQCNPNAEYRATSKYGDATEVDGNWEAEGIQAHVNTHANRNSTSLFVGLMTGTGADIISEPYRALFYRCALGAENTMMPVVQGMPTRGGGTSIISGNAIEQYYLMLHKREGVWQLAQENGDAGTTKQVVQRIEVVTVNNVEVINVYLYNPFVSRLYGQCSLSVFGYSALIDRGTYGGTTGGSFMSTKQVIVFANNSGTVVNASTVPNGTRCEIALTVLSA